MSKRLSCYLDEKAILSPKQHGFRKGKSTQSSISALLCDVYDNINRSLPTFLVFLDMKKAFDIVSHSIILDKVKEIGLGTRTIKWFSSYLGNRTQKVNLEGVMSTEKLITYGVPQGSVLGPLLF